MEKFYFIILGFGVRRIHGFILRLYPYRVFHAMTKGRRDLAEAVLLLVNRAIIRRFARDFRPNECRQPGQYRLTNIIPH